MLCNSIAINTALQGRVHGRVVTPAAKESLQKVVSQKHTRVSTCKIKKGTVQDFEKTACDLSLHNETHLLVNPLSGLVKNGD